MQLHLLPTGKKALTNHHPTARPPPPHCCGTNLHPNCSWPEYWSKQQQVSVFLKGWSLELMSSSVCMRERESVPLAAEVNLFDQSLHLIPVYFQESHGHFSRTLSPLCTAKAFPPPPLRPYSTRLAIIWRGEGFQHFSDISRFLTFMVKSPQTCLSSNPQCADMQVYELHT